MVLGPPAPWQWLQGEAELDHEHFARQYSPRHRRRRGVPARWRYFAADVVHTRRPDTQKLELAELYEARWGSKDLAAAMRYAHRQAPVTGGMAALMRNLTRAAA